MNKTLITSMLVLAVTVSLFGVNQAFATGGSVTITSPASNTVFDVNHFAVSGTQTNGTSASQTLTYSINGSPFQPVTSFSSPNWSVSFSNLLNGNYNFTINQEEDDFTNDTASINFVVLVHNSESPIPSLSKPSLGGVPNELFNDGLIINGNVFDISHYNNNIPQQALALNQASNISVKQQFTRGSSAWDTTILFMNFGNKDTETGNADTWITFDKTGLSVHDPNQFISKVSAGNTIMDSKTVVTSFQFTPIKKMSDSNLIVRVWDSQHRQNQANVIGAVLLGEKPVIVPFSYPEGVVKYTDYATLYSVIDSKGFTKPLMFNHIHSTSDVFASSNGQVFWLLDNNSNKLTRIIADSNGNTINSVTEQLKLKNLVTANACGYEQFMNMCGSDSIYGFSAQNKGLTEDQVQHLIDMGMWSGAIPYGMHINLASH